MAIARIEFYSLLCLSGGLVEAMAHVHGIGEMPCRPAMCGGDLQAFLQGLLCQLDVGDIAGLPSFLNVRIA
jgi:hypothetical protein